MFSGFFYGFYFLLSSSKSLKCKRKAVTEILISQKDIAKEVSKHNKLAAKRYMPAVCQSTNKHNMANTERNRHNTPKSCI